MLAVFAISAVASASASAQVATCYMVVEPGTGTYPSSEACEKGDPGSPKEWVMLLEPVEKTKIGAGEACAKVKPTEPSQYSNSTCTASKVGKGEYTKVKISQDIWQECVEKTGEGKEPPEKFDTNLCSTKAKELKLRKFEWKEIIAAKAVTSSGGEFTLTAGGKTVICKKVTDKGTVGPGSEDLAEEIKFEECTTGTTGCLPENKGGTAGTVVVTNIPTKLEQVVIGKEEILVDKFEQKTVGTSKEFVTLTFTGSSCVGAGYVETKVKGDVGSEVKNEANGEAKLTFPKTAVPQTPKLEAFGVGATLVGSDNDKLANGAGLRGV
jgi:hypothetical protein